MINIQNKNVFHCIVSLLILTCIILINSCTSISKKDGPPNFYVDERKIPNATPKPERLSRIGNKPSYIVNGRKYHVMRSSKHYEQVGIASWYGSKFHSHYTSNGERYNMLAMTAAHKSLPLPTYVLVTNLHNGRKVIVKVNDRGPFRSNRIIDLSYVAAKKLHMLGRGTALVNVKAIDPYVYRTNRYYALKTHKKAYYAAASSSRPVYLETGIFRNRHAADHMKIRLARWVRHPVQVARVTHAHKKGYLVQIGPIHTLASAKYITKQLRARGIKTQEV